VTTAPSSTRLSHLQSRVLAQRPTVEALRAMVDDLARWGFDSASKGELAELARRLGPVFVRDFNALTGRLDRLEKQVATGPAADAWEESKLVADAIDRVADDVIGFVEGSLARAAGVDRHVCSLVDRLLDWLASQAKVGWERTTLPAVREMASSRTWIISLRITDATIWTLPAMVHEFGHFALDQLQTNAGERPGAALVVPDWLDDEVASEAGLDRGEALRFLPTSHRHELFGDVYAAYATGPAYAAALAWRASPHRAWTPDGDHPGWGYRLRAVARALDPKWDWMIGFVERAWAADLEESGVEADADETRLALVERFVDDALEVLDATTSVVRYVDSSAVLDAEPALHDGDQRSRVDLRTIINAAWAARLRSGWTTDATTVGRDALDWALNGATLGGNSR
jgi:hypothetical protein